MTAAATPKAGGVPLAVKLAAAAALLSMLALLGLMMVVTAISRPAEQAGATVYGVSAFALSDIPSGYLSAYQSAASADGLDWAVLAGIGKVETNHGRLQAAGVTSGPNFLGCCGGPMQFFYAPYEGRLGASETNASTWGHYGVDGNGDGVKDVWDPADAIPAAAAYLKASGAPEDYRSAIWAYNHLESYYRAVMGWADRYRGTLTGGGAVPGGAGKLGELVDAAGQLEAMRLPYCYGGGHVTPAAPSSGTYCWGGTPLHQIRGSRDAGMDCSSSVSWLLQQIGYSLPTMTSGEFMSWGQPGPGTAVTIWANPVHVYLQIKTAQGDRFFGTSVENYRHGPGWHSARSPAGFVARHPQGL